MLPEHRLLILAAMLFCHVVDDFYLQGILATLKQSAWWAQNAPDHKYAYDYVVALIEHAFSWACVSTIPLLVLALWTGNQMALRFVLMLYIANTIIHAIVDDLKANARKINLWVDQLIHIAQLLMSWLIVTRLFAA